MARKKERDRLRGDLDDIPPDERDVMGEVTQEGRAWCVINGDVLAPARVWEGVWEQAWVPHVGDRVAIDVREAR